MKKQMEKLWTKDFIIVIIACAGISFCNYFFSSTLPIYAKNMTGSSVYAGLIMTVYTLAALVSRPLTGYLNDRFGRVRMLVIGAAMCAVTCFLYKFSGIITVLIIFRILHGFGFGIHSTSGATVAADVIPRSRMSEGLGIYGLYGTIASAIAPGIALSIIGDGEQNSLFTPLFILAAIISAACMVIDSRISYERKAKNSGTENVPAVAADEEPDEASGGKLPKTFLGFEGGVVLPAIVIVCLFVAFASVTSFLTLYAKERSLGNIGLFFTFSAIGMFLSRLLLGKVADRRGPDILVIPSLIVLFFLLWRHPADSQHRLAVRPWLSHRAGAGSHLSCGQHDNIPAVHPPEKGHGGRRVLLIHRYRARLRSAAVRRCRGIPGIQSAFLDCIALYRGGSRCLPLEADPE